MKRLIIFEILRKLKSKPELMRKVKILAVVGFVGFMFVGGLAIWAGISAFQYAVTTANQAVTSPAIQSHLQKAKAELEQIQLNPISCWNKAQSLMAVQPWLEQPALNHLRNLKIACLDAVPALCEGHECTQMKKDTNTTEGEII